MTPDDPKTNDAPPPKRPRKSFLLRLPPDLMTELRRWAAQDLRSLNGHIEYLLRDALRRRGVDTEE